MSFTLTTLSKNDREYSKFTAIQTGSVPAVNITIPESIKTYTFSVGSLTATTGTGSGLFSAYTDSNINGMLKALVVGPNNYNATGSLYLMVSGTYNLNVWSMKSGATTSMLGGAGQVFLPKGIMRTSNNVTLSGTLSNGMVGDIPLYGTYQLVGSGLGTGKSGLDFKIVYQ